MKAIKVASFVLGSSLLMTLFACGGGDNLFDQCFPWTLNADDAVTVAQGESFMLTVAPTNPATAVTGGILGDSGGSLPTGMKLEFVAGTFYISTEATTPKGVYVLRIVGQKPPANEELNCLTSSEEPITVTVD